MKRIVTIICLCAVWLTVQAQRPKMSLLVRQAADASRNDAATRRAGATDHRRLTAFVKLHTKDADTLLSAYGCRTYAQLGDICIASIPLNRIAALAAHPAVARIEASRPAECQLDTTPKVTHTLPIYEATADHQAYTGRGVVVGLMDIGFDLTHPTFYDAAAQRYRIGALWDMLSADTVGSPFPVGRDYVGYETVTAYGQSRDALTQGHGTHTTGIAAGNGYDTDYRGMAYESDLCLVANAVGSNAEYIDPSDYYKYTSATDALGFKYLFDYADRQGMPCVVSFSEGYSPYLDADDALYAEFLEQLTGPGRIMVASAGNEGHIYNYVEKPRGTAAAGAFVQTSRDHALYRVKTDGPMRISAYRYDSTVGTPADAVTFHSADPWDDDGEGGEQLTDTLFCGTDTLAVTVARYPSDFVAETIYLIYIESNVRLDTYRLALVVEGAESQISMHGSSSYGFGTSSLDPRWNAATQGRNIYAPGCFPAVICVGATTHRQHYQNAQGSWISNSTDDTPGCVSWFSSRGPSLNGLTKPDVVAPGANIVSSYNHHLLATQPSTRTNSTRYSTFNDVEYPWFVEGGTSMSTPAVAGIIALWLQAKPDLTPAEATAVMSRTCRQPDATLSYPNNSYGHGEIDAYRGLIDVLGLASSIAHPTALSPSSLRVTPQQGALQLTFGTAISDGPVQLKVISLDGIVLHEEQLPAGTVTATIALPSVRQQVVAVQADSRQPALCGSLLVRMP